jgi:arginine utilization regulatory protein
MANRKRKSINEYILRVEKEMIEKVLIHNLFNVTKAAIELGLPRTTLQYKIKILGLFTKNKNG